eukprot:3268740-Pleurochrysis_carterae.AAC.1
MFRLLQRRVEEVVGEERVTAVVAGEIDKLVEGVLAADLELGLVTKLLGSQAPDPEQSRAGTYSGEIELGRGDGPDSPRGHPRWPGAPGGAPGMAHVLGGGAHRAASADFGMVDLARRACVAEGGGLPLERARA